jgi:hypothetical protein
MPPFAGAVEIPTSVIVVILLMIALVPPLTVSVVVTIVHAVRQGPGERTGGRYFLKVMGISTLVWLALLALRAVAS